MTQEMTREQMLALLAQMQTENAKLKEQVVRKQTLTLKVSEKGAVSMYGLRRFPVTFYKGEWSKIIGHAKAIGEFIATNDKLLAVKD